MGRMGFVGQRLLLMVPVAIGVTIIVFFMIHLIPGDPARTILGIHATPRAVALLHQQWGLNRPLASQYLLFMNRLVHGNLGQSLFYGLPAAGLSGGCGHAVADRLRGRARDRDQRPAGHARRQPQGRHPRPRGADGAAARARDAAVLDRADASVRAGHLLPPLSGHRVRIGHRRAPALDVPAQPDRRHRPVAGGDQGAAGQHAERAVGRVHRDRAGQGRAGPSSFWSSTCCATRLSPR